MFQYTFSRMTIEPKLKLQKYLMLLWLRKDPFSHTVVAILSHILNSIYCFKKT